MNDKLKALYESYKSNGVISDKTTFEQFSSANEEQLQSLYQAGVSKRAISSQTDIETFKGAWSLGKEKGAQSVAAPVAPTQSVDGKEQEMQSETSSTEQPIVSPEQQLKSLEEQKLSSIAVTPFPEGSEQQVDLESKINKNLKGFDLGLSEKLVDKLGTEATIEQAEEMNQRLSEVKDSLVVESNDIKLEQEKLYEEANKLRQSGIVTEEDVDAFKMRENAIKEKAETLSNRINAYRAESEYVSNLEFNAKAKKGNWLGATWNWMLEGVGSTAAGETDYLIELFAATMPDEMIADPNLTEEERREALDKTKLEMRSYLRRSTKEVAGSESVTDEFMRKKEEGFFGGAWAGLVKSAPAMASPYMSGIFFQTSEAVEQELEGVEGVSSGEKMLIKAPLAVATAALERVGLKNVVKNQAVAKVILKKAIDKTPKSASASTFKKILDEEVGSGIETYLSKGVNGFIAEAETGGLQTATEIGYKNLYEDITDKDIFEAPTEAGEIMYQVIEGAAQEGVGGLIMSQPYALSKALKNRSLRKEINNPQFDFIEAIATNDDMRNSIIDRIDRRRNNGLLTEEEATEQKQALNEAARVISDIGEGFSTEQKIQLFDLVIEQDNVNSEIENLKSKNQSIHKSKIETLEAKANKIEEDIQKVVLGQESETQTDETTEKEEGGLTDVQSEIMSDVDNLGDDEVKLYRFNSPEEAPVLLRDKLVKQEGTKGEVQRVNFLGIPIGKKKQTKAPDSYTLTITGKELRDAKKEYEKQTEEESMLEGVRDARDEKTEGQESTELRAEEKEQIAESIGKSRKVKPKNIKGLLDVMGGIFGLNKPQAESAAVVGDVMVETMSKRAGVSKDEMYQRIAFQKAQKAPDGSLRQDAPLIFKSTAKEGLGKIQQKAATPEQWVKQIGEKGGKGTTQELEWIGLQDYLNEWKRENKAKSVPKEVVEQYINDNQIEIVEIGKQETVINVVKGNDGYFVLEDDNGNRIRPYDKWLNEDDAQDSANRMMSGDIQTKLLPRYSQYTLEGGENYREVLLTLPQEKPASSYKSSHWDETNIVAHLRINERTLPNGERVMFIEEVQSDWAQEGKKKGFSGYSAIQKEINDLIKKEQELLNEAKKYTSKNEDAPSSITDEYTRVTNRRSFLESKDINAVPEMPYKKTDQWVGMAMRRAMQMAAQEGFDRIAWTTGQQQFDRYGSSKVSWEKQSDGSWNVDFREQVGGQDDFTPIEDQIIKGDENVSTKEEFRNLVKNLLSRERGEYSSENFEKYVDTTTNKIWGRMQEESKGQSLPRKEGMEGFYDGVVKSNARKEAQRFDKKANVEVVDFKPELTKDEDAEFTRLANKADKEGIESLTFEEQTRLNELAAKDGETTKLEQGVSKQLSIPITPKMRMNLNGAVPLFQGAQGAMTAADGKYIVYALTNPNVSTPLHELAHVYEHYLTDSERKSIEEWSGHKSGTVEFSEKFARGFEKYLAEGKAPTSKLQKIFDRFKEWLTDIYNGIKGSEIDLELNDKMKSIYDQMLSEESTSQEVESETRDIDLTSNKDPKEKVKSFIKKWFYSQKNKTQPDIFRLNKNRMGKISSQLKIVENTQKDLQRVSKRENVEIKKIDQALRGEINFNELPTATAEVVRSMRNQIDNLTKEAVRNGLIPDKLIPVVEGNLGMYLTRSYKAFDDPNWIKKVPKEIKNKAFNFIKNEMKPSFSQKFLEENPNATKAEIDNALNVAVKNRMSELLDKDSGFYAATSKLGSKDLSSLKARKEIPEPIRALLGEYKDPLQNYAKSVHKMANLVANGRFLNDVKKVGTGVFLFRKDDVNRPEGFNKQIAAEGSETLSPLNGMWTSEEIYDALNIQPDVMPAWLELYLSAMGRVKWSKTLISYVTHLKNVYGNFAFLMMNGNLSPKEFSSAAKTVLSGNGFVFKKNKWTLSDSKKYRERYELYQKLGVVSQSTGVNELRDLIEDSDVDKFLFRKQAKTKWQRLIKGVQNLGRNIENLYQAEDDFFKVVSFEDELSKRSDAYFDKPPSKLSEEQFESLSNEVADVIRDTYPTYDMTPEIVNWVKKFPLVGTFVSFEAESIRVLKNSIGEAVKMSRSENEKIRSIGRKRIAGIISYMLLKYGLIATSMYLLGVDGEEDDDLRKFVPPWMENGDIVYLSVEDGKYSVLDLSSSDPYGSTSSAFNVLREFSEDVVETPSKAQNAANAVAEAFSEQFSTFIAEDILTEKMTQFLANSNEFGRPIYNTDEGSDKVFSDVFGHFYDAFEFGAVSSLKRYFKDGADVKKEFVSNITGLRYYEVDVSKSFKYSMYDFNDRLRQIQTSFNKVKKNKELSKDEILEEAKRVDEIVFKILQEASDYYSSAERLGVKPSELKERLGDTKTKLTYREQISSGKIKDNNISSELLNESNEGSESKRTMKREIKRKDISRKEQ